MSIFFVVVAVTMIADNSVIIRSKKRILDCFISDFKLEDFKRIQRT